MTTLDPVMVDPIGSLLTPREVAALLRVGYPTVQRWLKERRLPAVKIGKAYRVRRADLEAWFEAQRKNPAATPS